MIKLEFRFFTWIYQTLSLLGEILILLPLDQLCRPMIFATEGGWRLTLGQLGKISKDNFFRKIKIYLTTGSLDQLVGKVYFLNFPVK